MASTYSKLDLKGFKERLANKQYKDATGARRGVGKSEMSDDDKKKAHAAINAHFGVEAAPAAKAGGVKAKRGPAKKTAAVKTAGTKTKGAPRAKRAASAKKTASARGRKTADAEGAPATQELADLQAGTAATRDALTGLAAAAELDPGLDVRGAVQRGASILDQSITRIGEILGHPKAEPSTPPPAPSSEPEPAAEAEDASEGE